MNNIAWGIAIAPVIPFRIIAIIAGIWHPYCIIIDKLQYAVLSLNGDWGLF